MAVLGIGLSSILALANKKLHIFEDPRIEQVDDLLPHANCGACGFPGCRAFAEELVAGDVTPGACPVSSSECVATIAGLLGIEAGAREKRVARLACAGGKNVTRMRANYAGLSTCRGASLVAGGGKGCPWGCLGLDDCMAACPFDAITMDENELPVVDEDKCTACGACVLACPKHLFSLHDVNHRLWVACMNNERGAAAKKQCEAACIGCGLCAKDAAEGLIEITGNLAQIDFGRIEAANMDAIQRCPTGAIVWLDKEQGPIIGAKAVEARQKAAAKAAEEAAAAAAAKQETA